MAILLDQVEDGTKLTKKELEYHKKTKLRDVALLTLLLGTGIRVSECVGLDINDVDFNNGGIKIRRKGGYEAIVYFGDEVETALLDYLEQREHIIPAEGHENASVFVLTESSNGRPLRRESGKKIRFPCYHPEENHAPQTTQYIRYRTI